MFVGSFLYRMQGKGLVVAVHEEREGRGGMGGGMGGAGGPMGMAGVDVEQLRTLMQQVRENPKDTHAMLELTNTFMMMQAWDKALEFANMAAKLAPQDPQVHRALGMVRFQRKEYPEARQSFEMVLKKDPNDVVAHYNLGILLKHYMKKSEEGDQHFRRVVQLGSPDPDVLKSAQEELGAHGSK
jgi:Flp pilus assembly protein TadD